MGESLEWYNKLISLISVKTVSKSFKEKHVPVSVLAGTGEIRNPWIGSGCIRYRTVMRDLHVHWMEQAMRIGIRVEMRIKAWPSFGECEGVGYSKFKLFIPSAEWLSIH